MPLPQPPEEPEDALEGPRLPTLGGGLATVVGLRADRRESRAELGQEPDDLGRRGTQQVRQGVIGQSEQRSDRRRG